MRAEVRRWGHSFGVILPKTIAKKLDLKEHETVELKIKKGGTDLMKSFGSLKFSESTKKIIKEIKEGWKE